MRAKPPSSLDYEPLLHGLALESWRRALLDRDVLRARASAERLTRSSEKLWRWLGRIAVAQTELACGRAHAALAALGAAAEEPPEPGALAAVTRDLQVHVLVETDRAELALAAAASRDRRSLSRYWHGIALARCGRFDEASELARALAQSGERWAGALALHILGETEPPGRHAEKLRSAGRSLAFAPLASHVPALVVRSALAEALEASGDLDESLEVLESIQREREAILHWPIVAVRARYRLAALQRALGRRDRAREAASEFLSFWERGEMDRAAVESARQWVSS